MPSSAVELLGDRVRNLVLGQQLADAAVLPFGARTVVAEDVEDERVVAQAELFEAVDQAADLRVGMLDEAGEHLHQAALERPFARRECCPTTPWSSRAASASVSCGIQPMLPSGARRRARDRRPSRRRTCPCIGRPSP